MKKKNSAGKVRSALSCFLAVLLFVSLFAEVPFIAAADEGTSENASIEESADSWRYSNGSLIDDPVTDSEASSISTLSSSTTSVYPTWTSSNGLTSYSLVTNTTTQTVSVDGVVRVGVDVSKWNGEIDWEKVAASGVTFAIIRCGYGSDYEDQDDEYFLANVEGALAAGLSIGIYLYSYATKATGSAPSAESEAEHVLRLLGEAGLEPDDLDLPIFYDLEDSTQTELGAETLGDMAEAFCGALQKEGYAVGIYANLYWWTTYLTDEAFDNDIWYKWVARYPTSTSTTDCGVEDADLWQFTSRGTVDGIDGVVDIDFDYQGEGAYPATIPEAMTLSSVTLNSAQTSAVLTWKALSLADGYMIYRSADGGSYECLKTITDISTTTWTDTTLESGTTYKYKIRAYITTSNGTKIFGSYSSEVYVTTKPSKMTLSSLTLNSTLSAVTVKWEALSGADGYEIYRAEGAGSYELVKTIKSTSATLWKDTSVEIGVTYRYKIRAYVTDNSNSKVYGSFSSSKKVKIRPDTVTITSALCTSDGYISVTWEKVSNATGYIIYRSTDGGSYEIVRTIKNNSTVQWTDTSVSAGRVYRYKIKAYASSGSTTVTSASYSNMRKVTAKPGTVTISYVSSIKNKTATVKWKKVSGAAGYQIAYRTEDSSEWNYITVITNSRKFTNLKNKNYYIKVRAYTIYNGKIYYGPWSSETAMTVK